MLVKITPADADLQYPVSEIFVGVAGTLVLTLADDSVVTVQASGIVRFSQNIKRVAAASTASLLTADVPNPSVGNNLPEVNVSASRNAALTDATGVLSCNSASPINITVQTNSITAFSPGTVLYIYQVGTGASTFVAGAGVTIQGSAPTPVQFGHIGLRYRGFDTWTWV